MHRITLKRSWRGNELPTVRGNAARHARASGFACCLSLRKVSSGAGRWRINVASGMARTRSNTRPIVRVKREDELPWLGHEQCRDDPSFAAGERRGAHDGCPGDVSADPVRLQAYPEGISRA